MRSASSLWRESGRKNESHTSSGKVSECEQQRGGRRMRPPHRTGGDAAATCGRHPSDAAAAVLRVGRRLADGRPPPRPRAAAARGKRPPGGDAAAASAMRPPPAQLSCAALLLYPRFLLYSAVEYTT